MDAGILQHLWWKQMQREHLILPSLRERFIDMHLFFLG
jgi:hypothetical protein